jgi:NADPH-dependent glutamate synthase beta subunit-like oxidoreductase
MIKLKINNTDVFAEEGMSLLNAAINSGFEIPTMCNNGELEHFTSCMICLVKERSSGNMLASCSVKALNGMDIIIDDDEVTEARKTALELLLSEHTGDCEAPCRIACPAFMNIPLMNRLIAAGQTTNALEVVLKDIALPGVLGRICPAPCEGACKRKPIDQEVSICLLKRFTADATQTIPQPIIKQQTGKKAAIIGAGPAGLSAAYYLQIKGIQAIVFDRHDIPGGSLRYEIPDDILDKSVLDKEIENIVGTGAEFRQKQIIDKKAFDRLRKDYDAVVVATGNYSDAMQNWGLENNGKQLVVNKSNYLTNLEGVFAIGNSNRSMQLAIRSLAQGKEVAVAIEQMLNGKTITAEVRRFNSTIGKLMPEEYAEYLKEDRQDVLPMRAADNQAGNSKGQEEQSTQGVAEQAAGHLQENTPQESGIGLTPEQARIEAARCLHCDCRKPDNCKLRDYADQYKVSKKRYNYSPRKPLKKYIQHDMVVYEPGKCIKCGICVRLTEKYKERFGFTFIGRGFDTVIGVPFNEDIGKALASTAQKVVEACPTGALSETDQ